MVLASHHQSISQNYLISQRSKSLIKQVWVLRLTQMLVLLQLRHIQVHSVIVTLNTSTKRLWKGLENYFLFLTLFKISTTWANFSSLLTLEYVHSDLIRKAKNIFQSDRSNNLSHYLSLCVYLSSNNLLSPLAMNKLVALLAKTKFQVILGTLLQSRSTTTEIFMSNCLASAAELGEIEIVRTLIDHGVDVDVTRGNVERRTPLSLAIRNGNIECVRLLIESGSDLNPAAADKTPLQIACDTYKCSVEMVQLMSILRRTLLDSQPFNWPWIKVERI